MIGLQIKFEKDRIRNGIFSLLVRRPTWTHPMSSWIFKIIKYRWGLLLCMLQTKFEENWSKNGIFSHWADGYKKSSNIKYQISDSACYVMPTNQIWSKWDKNSIFRHGALLGLPGSVQWANEYSKVAIIDADSYFAYYDRPTNQILSKIYEKRTKNAVFSRWVSRWAGWTAWADPMGQFGISLHFVSRFLRRATYAKIHPNKLHLAGKNLIEFVTIGRQTDRCRLGKPMYRGFGILPTPQQEKRSSLSKFISRSEKI